MKIYVNKYKTNFKKSRYQTAGGGTCLFTTTIRVNSFLIATAHQICKDGGRNFYANVAYFRYGK